MGIKKHIDHQGNIFASRKEMCEYWNIDVKTYEQRHSKKWTIEECLTTPYGCKPNSTIYIDHHGNKFTSITAMAKHWNIAPSTLQARIIDKKMTIKDALTFTTKNMKEKIHQCQDHLGNVFSSKSEMCEYWNIPKQVYFGRIKNNWTLKDSLETPINYIPKNSKTIIDHEGNTFTSISKMCEYWNMTRSTYNARIKNGWSTKDALTTHQKKISIEKQKSVDHKGNEYESLNAMCKAYGITHHTFTTRLNKLGWSIEDALTKSNVLNNKEIIDYKNRLFPTIADFCHYYGLQPHMLQGKTITPQTLQKTMLKHFKPNQIITNELKIIKQLNFPYFLVIYKNYEYIMEFEEILQLYHNQDFYPFPNKKKDKNIKIIKCIDFPYYLIEKRNDKSQIIMSYWELLEYRKNTNFGLAKEKDT